MAWIQSALPYTSDSSTVTSAQITFDTTHVAGNCLLVYVSWGTSVGGSPASLSDSHGNTWTLLGTADDSATGQQKSSLYAAFGIAAGAPSTVTCSFSGSGANFVGMMGVEYSNASGVVGSAAVKNFGTYTVGTSGSLTTASVTTTAANQQIVAFFTNNSDSTEIRHGTMAAAPRRDSSYTFYSNILDFSPSMMIEDYVPSSAGSYTLDGTVTESNSGNYRYSAIAVALSTAATGGIESRSSGLVGTYGTRYDTNDNSGSSSGNGTKTVSVTTQAGDYVVVYGGGENSGMILATPSGNSISFDLQASVVTSGFGTAYIWSGQDTAGGTNWTLTVTSVSGTNHWGFTALVFRNIGGIGLASASNIDSAGTGTPLPSLTLTTSQADSSIVVFNVDFNAFYGGDGISRSLTATDYYRHWATVNNIAPTPGNTMELDYTFNSNTYTVYGGIYADVGAVGTKSVGFTFPDHQTSSLVALEILPPLNFVSLPWLLDPSTLYEMSESFDTYSNATSVTTASNPTKFTSIQSAASGTGVIDNTHVRSGSEALKITGTATSGNQFYAQYNFNATTDQTYVRAAFYFTAYPSANSPIMGITTVNDSGNIDQANVAITTTGTIQIYDGGAATSFTSSGTSMPLNQWFTLEYHLDWPNTQETVRAYNSSGTLIDTISTANGIYGGVRPNAAKIGVLSAPGTTTPAATLTYWLDSVVVSKNGWIGAA